MADPAVWIGTTDGVLVVSTADAVRLPNSVVVSDPASERPFAGVAAGDDVLVGDGMVAFASLRVRAARWFDPLPALVPTTAESVAEVGGSLSMRPWHPFRITDSWRH